MIKLQQFAAAAKLLQSCLTLCNPIDGSPLGSSIPGILQARILEWAAISFSTKELKVPSKFKFQLSLVNDMLSFSRVTFSSLKNISSIHLLLEWVLWALNKNTVFLQLVITEL